MVKNPLVPRPTKRTEYRIVFATSKAEKGWRDLQATTLNALAEAWDALTKAPTKEDKNCHSLKGSLGKVTANGVSQIRRQYELPGGARIWYYVTEGKPGTVHLLEVHTNHPNQTK
jgi:hypothetical protein